MGRFGLWTAWSLMGDDDLGWWAGTGILAVLFVMH